MRMDPIATSSAPGAEREPRIAYLIYRVERRLRVRIDEVVRTHGVTTTEYVALSVLRRRDGMSSAQLARWAFVTPQAMNVLIAGLEERSLVRRRPDPRHGRILKISVTRKGVQVLDRCDRSMDKIENDMLRDLEPASIEPLRATLATCAHSLEATRPRSL
jgi:DNA-binding MarR family transcriptional regulator